MTGVSSNQVNAAVSVKTSVRIVIGIALSVLTGVMVILAFPPSNVWPLILIAFVPYTLAQYRVLPLKWSSLAPAIATGLWLGVLLPGIIGLRGTWYMLVLPFALAVLFFFMSRERAFHERTKYRWLVAQMVLNVVGVEMIRSFIPVTNTWLFVGHPLFSQPWLIQPISIFSIYGLDLVVMLVNAALAQWGLALLDKTWRFADAPPLDPPLARRWLIGVGAGLAGWVALGLILLAAAPKDLPTVRVAAVQHGFPRAASFDQVHLAEERLQVLMEQTRAAAREGAQLAVWPEMGVGFDPQMEYTAELRQFAAETQLHIVIGYMLAGDTFRNEAVLLTPTGEFLAVYGKAHPTTMNGEPPGPKSGEYPVWDTSLGRLAAIICNDISFTDSTRILARQGARLVAIPTLEGPTIAAHYIYTQGVFRAVENRVATIKADVAYTSALIDPYGRILAKRTTIPGSAFYLVADVPLGPLNAPYTRLGDWLGWLALAGFIAMGIVMDVNNRQEKKARKAAVGAG